VADGGFLQKPDLSRHWDLRIYLHIEVADVLNRGTSRDQAWMDSAEAAAKRYRNYYIPGEELNLAEIRPAEQADIVIDNRNFEAARIMRAFPTKVVTADRRRPSVIIATQRERRSNSSAPSNRDRILEPSSVEPAQQVADGATVLIAWCESPLRLQFGPLAGHTHPPGNRRAFPLRCRRAEPGGA
jgi:hypothetical protein